MRRFLLAVAALFLCVQALAQYRQLPLGSIKADGWLQEQLKRQAQGLTGHLDQVYPEVMGPSNAWLGGDGDAWERGPYWVDGLLPLAYILHDEALIGKARQWVEAILSSQREDGYFGPAEDHPYVYGLQRGKSHDWWPKMVAVKILQQYYSATGDGRVIDCLTNYFRYQLEQLPQTPLDHWSSWARARGGDNLQEVLWLYEITGEAFLLDLARLLHSQSEDWAALFRAGDIFTRQGSVHTVNLAQGFKAPVVWWQLSGQDQDLLAPRRAMDLILTTSGFPTGLWAGDEQLQFGAPTRGSELCAAVEMMYSLEEMLRLSGDLYWADCLERIAYNALPTQVNDDYTAKQYYQQVNQVSCTRENKAFSTPHYGTDTLFGTLNGYPCCLSNMHQGWPKLVQNLWYLTPDGGLAALVFAPSSVTAQLGGASVTVEEQTDYPFRERVSFRIGLQGRAKSAAFPLVLRVPAWCKGGTLTINGAREELQAGSGLLRLNRTWRNGDTITLDFRAEVETETWYGGAWTVVRGPLVYALRMEEQWQWTPFEGEDRWLGPGAWEVTSPTPWNYCLMRDSFRAEACEFRRRDTVAAYPWNVEDAPMSLLVPARELPGWTTPERVAFWTEDGDDYGSETMLELIPYGCTTLRIAEFPTRIVPWDRELRKASL